MMYSAIVAVHPGVEIEFVDQNAMEEMPLDLQETVRGRQAQARKLTNAGAEYSTYLVWGTVEALAAAEARWGANLLVLDTWDSEGLRVGHIRSRTIDFTDQHNPTLAETIVGTPLRIRHPELMNALEDIVTFDVDGVETARMRPTNLDHLPVLAGHKKREL